MSWYKISQFEDPFKITSYNSYEELGVMFRGNNKLYTYLGVNKYLYDKIESLMRNKNYTKISKILNNLKKKIK